MFTASVKAGNIGVFSGRLDASQSPRALEVLELLRGTVTIDLQGLDYISSAGLSVLIRTHNRLKAEGGELILVNLTNHVRHIMHLARLDTLFTIR